VFITQNTDLLHGKYRNEIKTMPLLKQHATELYGGVEVKLPVLTSALDELSSPLHALTVLFDTAADGLEIRPPQP
jgi:hypothetical protein